MKKALDRRGSPEVITTDGLRSYGAAMNELGNRAKQEGWLLGKQPGRELASAISTTRAGDVARQADEELTKVCPCS